MHDGDRIVEARIDRLIHDYIDPAVYRRSTPATVAAWQVPDEPVPFATARRQHYEPFQVGSPWGGKPWGTTWFRITGKIPPDYGTQPGTSVELLVDLGFSTRQPGFQAEGLVWSVDGDTVKAIEPLNNYMPLTAGPGASLDYYLEAAANPDAGGHYNYDETWVGSKTTAGNEPIYVLRHIDIAERDNTVWELQRDLWTLRGLRDELPENSTRSSSLLRNLERALDAVDPDNVAGSAPQARALLRQALDRPSHASAHRMIAVGHAHIDSAWLWPVRETIRKCARTFTNVLQLMDDDPDFVFACSSAQQYAWIRDYYPELYARIKSRVAEGRWIPVGGMWVESDTNLPGGEALARQLLMGKQFFLDEFGCDTPEVWLPDSFGYTAAMPQLVRASGSKWFLTQKPSWNETNVMPHNSFLWEGIDGTRVLTHFPPADTYNSDVSGADLARAERQHKESGVSDVSMLLYGYGDGGGGPTREMLAAAHRTHDLEGSPRVELGTPKAAFEQIEATLPQPPVWRGEMYLELHRGTYTSQARTKRGNRRCEHLLREAELWATMAAVRLGKPYPYDELRKAWEVVLLQQFHDILPGSSIAWVYEVAEKNYADVIATLRQLVHESTTALSETILSDNGEHVGECSTVYPSGDIAMIRFNAAPVTADGIPPMGVGIGTATPNVEPVNFADGWRIDTGSITTTIDDAGLIVSIVDRDTGRELVPENEPAGVLTVYQDTPHQWDAWDVDQADRRKATRLTAAETVSLTPAGDQVEVRRTYGASQFITRYSAVAGARELVIETEVDWHERRKLLKLALPFDLKADDATSEIQFGNVQRPTHTNTSWDKARFETAAHRWIHVGEPDFGVAVANDSTYGHDVTRWTREDGTVTTTIRESLLRAPTFPDPLADQGNHTLRTVVRVAPTIVEAADTGYRINLPIREMPFGTRHAEANANTAEEFPPVVSVSSHCVFVEAVKLAEDRSGDVIVRLYEARGSRTTDVVVTFGFDAAAVWTTDLLERPTTGDTGGDPTVDEPTVEKSRSVTLSMRPFGITTLRVQRQTQGRA
ncbi:alpha-mannosidase [Spelaeicoccus albus]|uniref:Alpha-mannosidase n=1 Tax=Spelaeicoccus albus TaxID=1280376 RepID=A0A7Z0D045_9MICO|nr:glycoside hydrolase family 38 C-terminal domain-containing protein [Spelaeicoccus albus]NYI66986.1 alpha-mannosidase [Spelaeicoccus albus]